MFFKKYQKLFFYYIEKPLFPSSPQNPYTYLVIKIDLVLILSNFNEET